MEQADGQGYPEPDVGPATRWDRFWLRAGVVLSIAFWTMIIYVVIKTW